MTTYPIVSIVFRKPPEFKYGDCSACYDGDVLLCRSEQEDEPLHYVCKECFLRGL